MRTINAATEAARSNALQIGKQGENRVTQIDFSDFLKSCIAEFGTGTLALAHQRKEDESPYLATVTNGIWTITSSDVQYAGTGVAELTYTVGNQVKKSLRFKTNTLGALGQTVIPPAAWQGYVDAVTAQAAQVTNMTVSAVSAESASVTKGTDAQGNVHLTFGLVRGRDGSDASVTADNIAQALGYTPADAQELDRLKAVLTATYADEDKGRYLPANGITSMASRYAVCEPMGVIPGAALHLEGFSASNPRAVCGYKADGSVVVLAKDTAATTLDCTVPDGVYTVRACTAYDPNTQTVTGVITGWYMGGKYATKAAVSGKQDIISDLESIRSKANSAVQTETDPTVPDWAKAESKPTYQANEIGLGDTTVGAVLSEIEEAVNTHNEDIAELQSDKQDKLVAGSGITIADDGKTISASGGGSVEREWVLKGVWTDPSTDFTLTDMTGYTEMAIYGTHAGTGNCSLNGYIGTTQYNMLYNSVNNATRTIAGVFRDIVFGIESNARYNGGSNAIVLNAASQNCFINGIKISELTSLGFRNSGVCTSCNLKIYVR